MLRFGQISQSLVGFDLKESDDDDDEGEVVAQRDLRTR